MRKTATLFTTSCFLLALAACDAGYLLHLAAGQLESLGRTGPIEQALADQSLSDEERRKLQLVINVRQFAIDRVGLSAGNAYTVFDANGSTPAAYVVSAAAKDALVAFTWSFPFIGEAPYKGFFDEGMARHEADALLAAGFDVRLSPAEGFSTLGVFPDPVRQTNLRLPDAALAEFICHELTHSTVFKPGDTDFNEAMATFIGRAAAQAWFDETFGSASDEATAARSYFEDEAVIDEYAQFLHDSAADYYAAAAARGDTREQIIAGREAVFAAALDALENEYLPRLHDPAGWAFLLDEPIDNALILAAVRYLGGLSDFADVFAKTGGDFPATLDVFRAAAQANDSRQFLRDWVAAP